MGMFGDWKRVSLDLKGIPGKQKAIKDYILDESANQFQRGIQAKIVSLNIHPPNNESTAVKYAQGIVVERGASSTAIGLPKKIVSKGEFKLGDFAVSAEFGIHGNRYMGMWRNYIADFQSKLKEIVDRMQRE